MKIVNLEELKKMPNGTLFMIYEPEHLDGEIHIITGQAGYDYGYNGEILLTPFFDFTSNEKERITNWCTTDNSSIDYDEDCQFAVFSKTEIKFMLCVLKYALDGSIDLNKLQDLYVKGDEIINEKDLSEYTEWK